MPRDPVLPPPSNPMAVARKLVEDEYTHMDGLTLRNHRGDFHRWDGTCWPENDKLDIRRDAYRYVECATYKNDKGEVKPFAPTTRKVNDLLDALRACVGLPTHQEPPFWIEANPLPAHEFIAMQNGLLHLPTRTLHPHTPKYFGHHALAFPYLDDAPRPERWLAFLHELWPDDTSSIEALQEVFGYIMSAMTMLQKIVMFVGPKRGGKGTIGRVLTGLLGQHNVAAPTLASLATNFGLSPLIGKPLALVSDARISGRADVKVVAERLLSISGEDSITIDRKYRESWTGRLPARFVILTNELPKLTDASGALASRFVVFVMTRSFYGTENPKLTEELLEEAPSILTWALDGLDRLNARGYLVMPESGLEAVCQLEDIASPISAFIRSQCTVDARASVGVDDLWDAWKKWCEGESQHHGTKSLFGRDLKAALPTLKKVRPRASVGRDHMYMGITVHGHGDHYDQAAEAANSGHGGHSGHGNSGMYHSQNERADVAETPVGEERL